MKKIMMLTGLLGLSCAISAQAPTNVFPSNGPAGIGITVPTYKLDIIADFAGDGVRIRQSGNNSSALHLHHSTTSTASNHNWSIYSLGVNDGWCGAGGFAIQDITGDGTLPRFVIDQGGNVAIGGGYWPASKLEVSTSATNDGIAAVQKSTTAATLKLSHSDYQQGMWSLRAFGSSNTEGAGNFGIYDDNAAVTRLLVSSNGNITAGNNSTPNKTVLGSAVGAGLGYGTSYVGLNASRNSTTWTITNDGVHNGGSVIFGDVLGNIYFSAIPNTGNSNQSLSDATVMSNAWMRLKSTGQVLIGLGQGKNSISHPSAQLAVEGQVVCQDLYVTAVADWADYVFKPDYKLPSLYEIEKYYKTYSHLPEVPSEAEVLEKGISVAEMNKVLLKKVEELTILMVGQQKEIDALKEELNKTK